MREDWVCAASRGVCVNPANQRVSYVPICTLAPGAERRPEKHMFEELIFIISGSGATTVWNPGEPKLTFEWQKGSLFAIPLSSWLSLHVSIFFLKRYGRPIVMGSYPRKR